MIAHFGQVERYALEKLPYLAYDELTEKYKDIQFYPTDIFPLKFKIYMSN